MGLRTGISVNTGIGIGSGAGSLTAPARNPLLFGGWTEFWDATDDASFTLNGDDVISWAGMTAAHVFNDNGNAAQRPDRASTIGGKRCVNFDGVAEWLNCATIDLPAPGTTPTYYWGVFLLDTAANFEVLVQATGTGQACLKCANTSGDLNMSNTSVVNANTDTTIGQAFVVYCGFTASTADSLRVNAGTPVTGASAGTVNPTAGIQMGSRSGAASTFLDGKCLWFALRPTPLTEAQYAESIAWVVSQIGPLA